MESALYCSAEMRKHTTKRKIQNETNYFPCLRHDCGVHYHRISIGQEISGIQKKVRNVHELEEEELYQ